MQRQSHLVTTQNPRFFLLPRIGRDVQRYAQTYGDETEGSIKQF